MKALVIANSILPSNEILQAVQESCGVVVCADGGANRARAHGIEPDYIVGDFDSITQETRDSFPRTRYVQLSDQENGDLEKTLAFVCEQGIKDIILIGATGIRLDHQIVNLNIVEKYSDRLAIEIFDDYGIGFFITALDKPKRFTGKTFPGQQITLVAFKKAEGIITSGLKYPLKNETLEWAVHDGLSNEALSGEFGIILQSGSLFCYQVSGLG